jgi:hypothetical protein
MPDAKLTDAMTAGTLATKEGISSQIAWMLTDERGKKVVNRFLESWTHVQTLDNVVKDSTAYPEWDSATFRASLYAQAQAFFDHVLTQKGGKLSELFTSPTVFYNKDLGGYYGLTGSDTFQSVDRTDGSAAGLLTLPAVLAVQAKPSESSPIYRGRFVREALLCQQLPSPPANVPKPPEVDRTSSTRERLSQHEVDPTCAGCHQLLDPVGFGFENYDAVGHYRTEDGGKPVDASGNISGTRDMDGPFNGIKELAAKLAGSSEVEECVARQWFRFTISRFEQDVDGCSMKSVIDNFKAAGQDLNSLPSAIVQTDAFLYRRPIDAQVMP